MADSSEKVSFCVDVQYCSRQVEAFLVFDKGSQPTGGQQITDMRPTVGRQSTDKRPTVCRLLAEDFHKSGKQQSADSWPTVVPLLANCWPTVGQQSADSFLGELFFISSEIAVVWMCSFITHSKERCVSVRFYQESALL